MSRPACYNPDCPTCKKLIQFNKENNCATYDGGSIWCQLIRGFKNMTIEIREYQKEDLVNFKFDTVEDAQLFALTAAKVGLKVKKNNKGKIHKTVEVIVNYK